MEGDDEGARFRPDVPSDAAATPASGMAADVDALPSSVPSGSAPSHLAGAADSATEGAPDLDSATRPVSLAPLWTALAAFAVILIGSLLYFYSLLPDGHRLEAIEQTQGQVQSQLAALKSQAQPADLGPVEQRLQAAEKQLSDLQSTLKVLQDRTAAPQTQATQPASNEAPPELAALGSKVADSAAELARLQGAADDAKRRADRMDQAIAAVSEKMDALPKVDLGPIVSRLDAFDGRLQPIEKEREAAKSPERVTSVRQNGSAAETRAAPVAVTADAILRDVDAGRPFAGSLKALVNLGVPQTALQPLSAVAEAGAPTTKDLRAELASLRERLATKTAPTPTGSYVDRLLAGASTLVQVKPSGSVIGDTPAAVAARMDEDLARDDLTNSLAEYQKLPDTVRADGKGLADRIRLRQAAQEAARAVGADAIKALASDQP